MVGMRLPRCAQRSRVNPLVVPRCGAFAARIARSPAALAHLEPAGAIVPLLFLDCTKTEVALRAAGSASCGPPLPGTSHPARQGRHAAPRAPGFNSEWRSAKTWDFKAIRSSLSTRSLRRSVSLHALAGAPLTARIEPSGRGRLPRLKSRVRRSMNEGPRSCTNSPGGRRASAAEVNSTMVENGSVAMRSGRLILSSFGCGGRHPKRGAAAHKPKIGHPLPNSQSHVRIAAISETVGCRSFHAAVFTYFFVSPVRGPSGGEAAHRRRRRGGRSRRRSRIVRRAVRPGPAGRGP